MQDNSIGGFIELEFYRSNEIYHPKALALANGRACLNLFLEIYKPKKIYLPYYTCDTLIAPLKLTKTPYEFFKIDKNLDPKFNKKLSTNEYLLYINYFDVKNRTISKLEKKYGSKLIIDNTQAFYKKKYKKAIASFNSCRKFFGVADGGYLYLRKKNIKKLKKNNSYSIDHLLSRFIGDTKISYKQFLVNERKLNSEVAAISSFSEAILARTDYSSSKEQRIQNFNYLHFHLSNHNLFRIDEKSIGVPNYYPFLPGVFINREKFYSKNIFISTFWTDVLNREIKGYETEKHLSANLLPLPIDQRYTENDLQRMLKFLKPYL